MWICGDKLICRAKSLQDTGAKVSASDGNRPAVIETHSSYNKAASSGKRWCKSNCLRLTTSLLVSVRLGQNKRERIRLFRAF